MGQHGRSSWNTLVVSGAGSYASGSSSRCPEYAYFEPVHGSAPDIDGCGVANPIAATLSVALMLAPWGNRPRPGAPHAPSNACWPLVNPPTADLGGSATSAEITAVIVSALVSAG